VVTAASRVRGRASTVTKVPPAYRTEPSGERATAFTEALKTGRQPAMATPVAAVIAATLRWLCPETVSKTPPA